MTLRSVLATALLLSLAACAGTSRVMLSDARPPVDPATVRIYTAVPPGAIQIAQLDARSAVGFGTQGQTDAVVRRLKNEAARLGANGVVLIGVGGDGGRSPVGVSVGGGSYGGHVGGGIGIGIPTQQKQGAGIAIYVPPGVQDPSGPRPLMPPPPPTR
jgi:hypothetical protein